MKPYVLILSALLCLGCHREQFPAAPPATPPFSGQAPKNIILMIGDGMGLTQVTAGLYSNGNSLALEQCTATGMSKTYSASHLVTDSGAGATAFACGCKTYNLAIGMDQHKKPCATILEQAAASGRATGLVVTSSLTHATPASFVAHVRDRKETEAIAAFFVENTVDLAIGGGLDYFVKRSTDTRNLRDELTAKGCVVSDYSQAPLQTFVPDTTRPFFWFSADGEPKYVTEGRDYLPAATRMAAPFLQKRGRGKGFFLMVEGSQIDWACHKNNAENAVREMLDFDAAIGAAIDFARADGQTLVIITADHETGGMSIVQGSEMGKLEIEFNTEQHTAALVPVFAYGPGSELFNGVYENTDIYWRMRKLLGL